MRVSKSVSAIALAVAGAGCGGGSTGDDVKCGPGTMLDASVCYVASGHVVDASVAEVVTPEATAPVPEASSGVSDATEQPETAPEAAADVAAEAQSPVTFDGVTAVAPAATSALFIAWAPASPTGADAGGVFTYDVYVGTTPGGENFGTPTATTAPGALSIVIANGLTASTTYYVVVRAVDAQGHEEGNSVEMSAKTQVDSQAPSFAGATAVASAAEASLTISWTAATDDLTPPAGIIYDVYLSTTSGGENLNVPSAVSAPGATSMTVSGLSQASTKYYVIVRAVDAAGNVDQSPEDTIEVSGTSGSDDIPPVFGGCSSAIAEDAQSISVTWTPAVDNSTPQALIAYDVFASKTEGGQNFNLPTKTFTATSASPLLGGLVDGLSAGTTYYVVCRAHDLSNNEDQNAYERVATTLVDSTPPVFAGVTTVGDITSSTVTLNWAAATDNQTPQDEITYLVYQGTASGGEVYGDAGAAVAVSTPGATSVTVSGLSPGTKYYWIVRSEDRAGNIDQNTVETSATTLVSFSADVIPILQANCAITGCHVPGTAPNGLEMIPSQAYQDLVGVTVVEDSAYERVNPGNAADSYMYLKISETTPPAGVRMPADGDYLDQTDIDTIETWINQGAHNN